MGATAPALPVRRTRRVFGRPGCEVPFGERQEQVDDRGPADPVGDAADAVGERLVRERDVTTSQTPPLRTSRIPRRPNGTPRHAYRPTAIGIPATSRRPTDSSASHEANRRSGRARTSRRPRAGRRHRQVTLVKRRRRRGQGRCCDYGHCIDPIARVTDSTAAVVSLSVELAGHRACRHRELQFEQRAILDPVPSSSARSP